MEEKTLQKLEFYTVLQQVASFAVSPSAKALTLALRPIDDITKIQLLLKETGEALWLINKNIIPSFNFDNVDEALKKAKILYSLTIRELLAIKRLLTTSRNCVSLLTQVAKEIIPIFTNYAECLYQNKFLENELERCFLNEEDVADDATPELLTIRKKIKKATLDIKEKLNSIVKSSTTSKYLQDTIVTVRNDRYVLPVKQEYKNNIQGLIHDQSASGATVYIEPISVVNLNNQIKELLLAEREEIEKIIANFTRAVAEISDNLSATQENLAYIDSVYAKAYYSEKQKATLPILNQKGLISINKGRHPLLNQKKVVPINIKFGDSNRLVIVTGPNTGGKTVSLKTVGLFCLMTYVGLYLPAEEETHIAVFDNVFCDIGDEQSIEQNLSTFSSHIKNINNILNNLTDKSLVLIDEIGAGTEPIEGSALGLAVCEYLIESNSRCIISTHYGQLKEFSITTPNVVSASMEFNTETFEPTYKLIMGIPGNSNALEIAKRLGMNKSIIERAYQKVDENKKSLDTIIKNAESLRQQYELKLSELDEIKQRTEEEYNKAKNQNKLLLSEREKLLKNSQIEAKRIVSSAKEEAEELLDSLKKLFKKQTLEESNIFEARSIVKKLKEKKYIESNPEEDNLFEGNPIDINTLQMGDKVYVKKLKTVATVTGLPKANKIEVKFNNMVTILKQGEAYEFVSTKKENPKQNLTKSIIRTQTFSTEINLIGQTVDEGIYNLEKFLDEALMQGVTTDLRIIHGRGTGKLKSAVHQYLKTNKSVQEYRLGSFNEGNGGVTIVKLK